MTAVRKIPQFPFQYTLVPIFLKMYKNAYFLRIYNFVFNKIQLEIFDNICYTEKNQK